MLPSLSATTATATTTYYLRPTTYLLVTYETLSVTCNLLLTTSFCLSRSEWKKIMSSFNEELVFPVNMNIIICMGRHSYRRSVLICAANEPDRPKEGGAVLVFTAQADATDRWLGSWRRWGLVIHHLSCASPCVCRLLQFYPLMWF